MPYARLFLGYAATLLLASAETSVSVRQGNVYITRDGSTRQLTRSGSDSDAAVSRDGRWIVFVREAPQQRELWIAGAEEQTGPRMLSKARGPAERKDKTLPPVFHSPRFSADGKTLLLVAETTSGPASIWKVDVDGGDTHAIFPEVSRYAWIESGANAGKLLVAHKSTCFVEQSKYPCYPIMLLNPGPPITGQRLDKDDEHFDEILARYSR